LNRGPLDGVLAVAALRHALAVGGGSDGGAHSSSSPAWKTVSFLLATEDPQAVLSALGPRGLLRFLDLLWCFKDLLEPSAAALRCCLSLLWALQSLSKFPRSLHLPSDAVSALRIAVFFRAGLDVILRLVAGLQVPANPPPNPPVSPELLLTEFQNYRTVATVMQFLGSIPKVDVAAWRTHHCEGWWRALSAGMQLLSTLVLHNHVLAHEFVQHEGLQMLVERKLLSAELVASEAGAHVVVDALLIVSQLSRLSKEYYPMLHRINICLDLRDLLACGNANVRAKACNAIGNMARHSDAFYEAIREAGILQQLTQLCADSDSACRKFASFALGNSAFHSDVLYRDLAQAVPQLLRLLHDADEKTRANAAGAIGNLVRNSGELCGVMIREAALQSLSNLIESRRPLSDPSPLSRGGGGAEEWQRFAADSSVKIALFSLGNLAVHADCRAELKAELRAIEMCHSLMTSCQPDDMIHKYSQRLLQKLSV
ncbi:unnamed protein product, partial [Polarella glacialis]